jgi:hypothetical protein
MTKLSGYTTVRNALSMDYPFVESIGSMLEFCDEVCVLDSSDKADGTRDVLAAMCVTLTLTGKLQTTAYLMAKPNKWLGSFARETSFGNRT